MAVACCTHALTDGTLRLLSLSGVHPTQLSPEFWLSFDRRKADLQDVFLNEPWFLIEGCLAGWLAHSALPPCLKRRGMVSAVIVTAVATAIGVASGVGLIPSVHIG